MGIYNKAKLAIFNIRVAIILILIVILGSTIVLNTVNGFEQIDRIGVKIESISSLEDQSEINDLAQTIQDDMRVDLYGEISILAIVFIILIFEIGYTLGNKKEKKID